MAASGGELTPAPVAPTNRIKPRLDIEMSNNIGQMAALQ